jgi:hypothetical protein
VEDADRPERDINRETNQPRRPRTLAAFIAGALAGNIGFTNALLWTVPFPWLICGLIYSLFYWSYPRDSAGLRALMVQRAQDLP